MKFLFWNLKKNKISDQVSNLILLRDVDIALFAEHQGLDIKNLEAVLPQYKYIEDAGCEKIKIFCRKNISVELRQGQHNYIIFSVSLRKLYGGSSPDLIIAGIHLPAMQDGKARRKKLIQDLIKDIQKHEDDLHSDKTIVIGDFNANPFDEELAGHTYFNAVLFKDLIQSQEVIKFAGDEYKRFYNPMLHYISEDTKHYGSFYYHDENLPLYWHCLDQIIVRKSLSDSFQKLEYCRSIGDIPLIKTIKPDENYSDHLPLFVEIDMR